MYEQQIQQKDDEKQAAVEAKQARSRQTYGAPRRQGRREIKSR